ncbi:hypothetical protein AAHE18_19G260500 [Arachis hypogaea]
MLPLFWLVCHTIPNAFCSLIFGKKVSSRTFNFRRKGKERKGKQAHSGHW